VYCIERMVASLRHCLHFTDLYVLCYVRQNRMR